MFIVEPYLFFNGNCEEAFNFYKSVFGGEFVGMMKYKDMPEGGKDVAEELKDKILHVSFPIGREVIIMGSDAGPGEHSVTVGNNIMLTLSMDDEEETKRLYQQLSEGGKVNMELQKTFWAELYAMFTDKFGINWSVNYGYVKED